MMGHSEWFSSAVLIGNRGSRKRVLTLIAVAFAIWVAVGDVQAGDWTTYRADIARTGITSDVLASDLTLHWIYRPGCAPRPAWPSPSEELPRMHSDNAYHATIAQGIVYFGSSVSNSVLAIDAATGAVRWIFYAHGPVRFAPTVDHGRVYFGSDDGHVYCLDAVTGATLWNHRAGPSDEKVLGNGRMISLWPVRTSVLVDQGIVHFAAGVFPYEGLYVYALNADNGSVVWVNDTVGDRAHELEFGGLSPHGYLVASSKILYVPSGRAMPAAFDRSNGQFLFFASPGGKRGGTWALLDDTRLIAGVDASGTPSRSAYDATTGVRQDDAFAWFAGTDMAVTPDSVYLVNQAGVCAVNRNAYSTALQDAEGLVAEQQAVDKELTASKAKLRKELPPAERESLNAETEQQARRLADLSMKKEELQKSAYRWRYAGKDFTSVIRTDNLVVAGGRNLVVALDVNDGQEVWRGATEGLAVGLAVADGRLIVSTDRGVVHCFANGGSPNSNVVTSVAVNSFPEDALSELYQRAAEQIVATTGVRRGYGLILDCGEGRLACELAKQTELYLIGIETDVTKLQQARTRLEAAGLWGSRVVVEPWDLHSLPDYFANLIVSDGMLTSDATSGDLNERRRVLRPWGGVEILGRREQDNLTWTQFTRGPLEGAGEWSQQFADSQNTACSRDQLVGGPLGMLWYGEPGPQGMVERHGNAQSPVAAGGRLFIQGEHLIRAVDAFNGTLLWERAIPGAVRVKIKADSGNLAVTDAGLFVAALDKCYRLDPATGQTVRVYELPASSRGKQRRWGYLSISGRVLYGSTAQSMTNDYGAMLATFLLDGEWRDIADIAPELRDDYDQFKKLYPTGKDLQLAAQRSGYMYSRMTRFPGGGEFTQRNAVTGNMLVSDAVFALDIESGELLWEHTGQQIANIAIAIGDGKLFLTDAAASADQRAAALADRQRHLAAGTYRIRSQVLDELAENKQLLEKHNQRRATLVAAGRDTTKIDKTISQAEYLVSSLEYELYQEENPAGKLTYDDADVRVVAALDATTGAKIWERPVELTGCCGDHMGAAYSDGLLLFFGNHGNHDAWRFREGGLQWRRITTLAAQTGELVWSRPLNYRTRPLIVGDQIIIEPQACYLHTGEIVQRDHPVTGQKVAWEFLRPGHTCGVTAASAVGLFYRSACTAFYDLPRDNGVTLFGGYRPGCAISVVPACGLLLSAEAAAGCTCSYPVRCTFAMKRKDSRAQPWTVYVSPGELRPVKHLALNLGAAADRKDESGTVWFAYPSPNTAKYTHFPNYGIKFDLREQVADGGGFFSRDFKGHTIPGTDRPWLFASGCNGLVRCDIPLLDPEAAQSEAFYDVRIGFCNNADDQPNQRVFDIVLQGKTVHEQCDIAQLAGGTPRALVLEFQHIVVHDVLSVELKPRAEVIGPRSVPIIHSLEVLRQE
jgi:outer membrane protein assembly factor BamB